MEYTVNQLAQLSGLTPRTLRWYDEIGLLCPTRAQNGYRKYGPAQVQRLQQILLYRTAGMELDSIAALLDEPGFDAAAALSGHLAALKQQRRRLDGLIAATQKTLQALKGETTMSDKERFEAFKKGLIDENEKKYGKEVRERWGSEAADASNAKMMNMTAEQYQQFQALGEELNATLKAAVAEGDPAGQTAQKAAELHKQWLCYTWPQYQPEAHRNLTQMYVDDERFTAYYEEIAPGAAAFLRDAVGIYLDNQAK